MVSRGARLEDAGGARRIAREWWPLALIVAVGAYLRLANLGALGFRWDEDLSGLAVRAILEKGLPELPSGMIYLRGGLFSHLMAASASLLGFSEFSLRLPAALFGIALIVVAYVFGAALFGRVVGLVTAAVLAISFWDIDLARYARFYSAFSVFYVLTLYAIWQFRVKAPSAAGGVLCVALAIVTLSLHDLAYSLALAFFYPLALARPCCVALAARVALARRFERGARCVLSRLARVPTLLARAAGARGRHERRPAARSTSSGARSSRCPTCRC